MHIFFLVVVLNTTSLAAGLFVQMIVKPTRQPALMDAKCPSIECNVYILYMFFHKRASLVSAKTGAPAAASASKPPQTCCFIHVTPVFRQLMSLI